MRTTIVAAVYASWTALGRNSDQETKELLHRDAGFAERHAAVDRRDAHRRQVRRFGFVRVQRRCRRLQRSTLRGQVNREEQNLVPSEFLEWVWAGGRKLKGLVRRREAEARLYADYRTPRVAA